MVGQHHRLERVQRLEHTLPPRLLADLVTFVVAAGDLDGRAAEGAVRELHVRQQPPVEEHRAPDAGARVITSSIPRPEITAQPWTSASLATRVGLANRPASAVSSSKPVHMATSSGSGGSPGPRRENAGTSRTGRPDGAGEPDGHAVVVRLGRHERGELLQQDRRGARVGRLAAGALRGHLAVGCQHDRLEPGPADVDRQRARSVDACVLVVLHAGGR
ncbi:hypothetical protein BJF90_38475 [Pseudonocardia sp. CNS-004]|nr:hypothetical protein BJF90_38475 [Pseudonocardia sp. CNS-004]